MTQEKHLPPITLPFDERFGYQTFARWSVAPRGKLLIFVHGFKGSATGTWAGFPNQLCLHPETEGYDVVSFGYKSVKQDAGHSANQLHVFLNELLTTSGYFNSPHSFINKSLMDFYPDRIRTKEFKYEKVVLVGHSLGACIIRRAFLNQIQGGEGGGAAWPSDSKMIWFAPAHHGARVLRLLTAVTLGVGVGMNLSIASTFFAPVLEDLKEKSKFLDDLLKDTVANCPANPQLKSPLTFWASGDRVVIDGHFVNDRNPYKEILNTGHISVCKPADYDLRTELLLKEL